MSHYKTSINTVKLLFIQINLVKIHLYRTGKLFQINNFVQQSLALRPQHK